MHRSLSLIQPKQLRNKVNILAFPDISHERQELCCFQIKSEEEQLLLSFGVPCHSFNGYETVLALTAGPMLATDSVAAYGRFMG